MKQYGVNPATQCPIYSISVADFDAIEQVSLPSVHTVMLIVADARNVPDATITKVAEHLLKNGLVYVCVWGPDCERVHDLFDWAHIGDGTEEPHFTLMSTWHSDEPLDEAIWFFMTCAVPLDDEWKTTSYLAVIIGNAEWAVTVEAALSDISAFKARLVEGNDSIAGD